MTIDNQNLLPNHPRLDIPALSGLFKSTTNSYKYLFFLSILNELKRQQWKPGQPKIIPLNDLAVEMVLLGWYPLKFFNLSFGKSDDVVKIIDKLDFSISNEAITTKQGAPLKTRRTFGKPLSIKTPLFNVFTPARS